MTKLAPPEQYIISKMTEMETAEMIEKYIDFYTERTPLGAPGDAIRAAFHAPE
jgi:hypothetical protein